MTTITDRQTTVAGDRRLRRKHGKVARQVVALQSRRRRAGDAVEKYRRRRADDRRIDYPSRKYLWYYINN